MFSYFEPNFFEKFLWESGFSNFGQNRKRRDIKIGCLAAILKRCNIFTNLFPELWFLIYSAYIYGAYFIAKSRWESGFLKGEFHGTPFKAPTGVKVPWSFKC